MEQVENFEEYSDKSVSDDTTSYMFNSDSQTAYKLMIAEETVHYDTNKDGE